MIPKANFADPGYEPSDEDLMALAAEAFADVPEARRRALEELRRKIAEERASILSALSEDK